MACRCKNRASFAGPVVAGLSTSRPADLRSFYKQGLLPLARLLQRTVAGSDRRLATESKRKKSDMTAGKTDELKGRVKEAAGALTGDAKLKREGRLDQAVGQAKQAADKVIEKVKRAVK